MTTPVSLESKPLDGLRVLDLVTGPMAAITRHFAELGADVIRLESEGGAADRCDGPLVAGISLSFVAANLGKRAGTCDRLSELAADADILIAPLNVGGLSEARAANPRLVTMAVSDFGDTEGFREWNGSGSVYHALTGELSRSGIPGREPLLPPEYLALSCAAVQAAYVVLLAYYNALRTGRGDHLDFSVLDGAAQALDPGYGIAGSATAGIPAYKLPRGRAEARHQYPIVPCMDGFVRLCVLAPRQWRGMFEWMGRPAEFADPSYEQLQTRFSSPTLIPAIAAFFADKTRLGLEAEGQRYGVPTAAVLDLDEALASEQILARRAFVPLEIAPGLEAPFPDGVVEIDGKRMGLAGPAPQLPAGPISWRARQHQGAFLDSAATDRPLQGLRVLDLGVIVVGAEGGRLLADQGADVIKVENASYPDGSRQNRGGGPISPTFATGHRNKRGFGVNLKHPQGKAVLLKLVEKADVLLSNFKGGTLESLGLDYASLKIINPRIIVTDSSAFGPSGPWAKRLGYGPLVRASAGLTMQWRYDGEPDSFSDAITVYPDHVAARIGAIGVLALLIRRLRTGMGGSVSISQAEVMLSHMAPAVATRSLEKDGHQVESDDVRSAVYRCLGDDEWCVVTLRDEVDAHAISAVTGPIPLAAWMAERSPHDAMKTLQAAGVPAGAMLRVSELPDFSYFARRSFFREATHPYLPQPFTVENAPVQSQELPDPPDRPAPLMGEHTVEIARENLALPENEIAELIAMGAVEQYALKPIGSLAALSD